MTATEGVQLGLSVLQADALCRPNPEAADNYVVPNTAHDRVVYELPIASVSN